MKRWIIANWKENKTLDEATFWLNEFKTEFQQAESYQNKNKRVGRWLKLLIAPSFPLIPLLRQELILSPILSMVELCAQNVSHFEKGPYTGEVSALQLRGLVNYVLVGHSERREHFGETNQQINQKIRHCLAADLTPVVCVSNLDQVRAFEPRTLNLEPTLVAYEPLFAIGTDQPDTPESAGQMALAIKEILSENTQVLYGGSVTADNARSFVEQKNLAGLLVGASSLEAKDFAGIIKRFLK